MKNALKTLLPILLILLVLGGAGFGAYYFHTQHRDKLVTNFQANANDRSLVESMAPNFQDTITVPVFDEVVSGDVISFDGYNYQLGGKVIHATKQPSNYSAAYADDAGHQYEVTIERVTDTDYTPLVEEYLQGNSDLMQTIASTSEASDTYYYYQNATYIPLFSTGGADVQRWYSIVHTRDKSHLIVANTPVVVTDALATINYRKVEDIDFTSRVRSKYEEEAVANTLKQLTEGRFEDPTTTVSEDFSAAREYVVGQANITELNEVYNKYSADNRENIDLSEIPMESDEPNSYTWYVSQNSMRNFSIGNLDFEDISINYNTAGGVIQWFKGDLRDSQLTITNQHDGPAAFICMIKFMSQDEVLDYILLDTINDPIPAHESRTFPLELGTPEKEGVLDAIQYKCW